MGGGGLMQLVAYGAQDIYLTGKPQITFFKAVYRRYTNFAIESIQQDILGSPQFGNLVNLTISPSPSFATAIICPPLALTSSILLKILLYVLFCVAKNTTGIFSSTKAIGPCFISAAG